MALYFIVSAIFSFFIQGRYYYKLLTLVSYLSCLSLVRFIVYSTVSQLNIDRSISGILQQVLSILVLCGIAWFIIHFAVKTTYSLPKQYQAIIFTIITFTQKFIHLKITKSKPNKINIIIHNAIKKNARDKSLAFSLFFSLLICIVET